MMRLDVITRLESHSILTVHLSASLIAKTPVQGETNDQNVHAVGTRRTGGVGKNLADARRNWPDPRTPGPLGLRSTGGDI